MKRAILLLSSLIVGACVASAQRVNFMVGGGLSSHFGGSTRSIGAVKAGVSYEHELPGNVSIEPGVFFYAKGFEDRNVSVPMLDADGNPVYDADGKELMGVKNVSTSAFYVEVPVMANYYVELAPLHYLELSAGPFASVGVGGKRKTRGDTDEEGARRYYYERSTFKAPGVRRFDCGIACGVAYEFSRMLAVGVQADFSLTKFRRSGGRNVAGIATLSYRLRLD